MSNIKFTTH